VTVEVNIEHINAKNALNSKEDIPKIHQREDIPKIELD
jgi:hypothetical protein